MPEPEKKPEQAPAPVVTTPVVITVPTGTLGVKPPR